MEVRDRGGEGEGGGVVCVWTLTSMMVPLVMTPRLVKVGDWGFFFTPIIGRQKVAFS